VLPQRSGTLCTERGSVEGLRPDILKRAPFPGERMAPALRSTIGLATVIRIGRKCRRTRPETQGCRRLMHRQTVVLVALAGAWCLLSGHYSGLLLSLGLVSCLACCWIYHKISIDSQNPEIRVHPIRQLNYLAWLLVQIFKSNVQVIGAVISPGKISPQFFKVKTGSLDEAGRVIYANSITLTPGTVSTRVSEDEIQVHALLESSRQGLMDNKMLGKVQHLRRETPDRSEG